MKRNLNKSCGVVFFSSLSIVLLIGLIPLSDSLGSESPLPRSNSSSSLFAQDAGTLIEPRAAFSAVVYENWIYAIGGWGGGGGYYPDVEVYDIATDTWQAGPSLNKPEGYFCACVEHNGWIYSFQSTTVKALDVTQPLSQQIIDGWQTVTTTNIDVGDAKGAVVIGNRAYITGEYDSNLYYYDFHSGDGGVETALLSERTMGFGMCAIGDDIYLVGGCSYGPYDIIVYNANTKSWSSMWSCGSYNCRAVGYNGAIYAIGGGGYSSGYCGDEIEEISIIDGTCDLYDTMLTQRGDVGAVVVGNNLYVIGGYLSTGDVTNTMEIISLPASPIPDIKANGSDGPISITRSDILSVTVELDPGDYTGVQTDWWLWVHTPLGWYHYNLASGWRPGKSVTRQGALFDLPSYEVANMAGLPEGRYVFLFGVDFLMDGAVNRDQLHYDMVVVNINP
jgi:hypothetical protein